MLVLSSCTSHYLSSLTLEETGSEGKCEQIAPISFLSLFFPSIPFQLPPSPPKRREEKPISANLFLSIHFSLRAQWRISNRSNRFFPPPSSSFNLLLCENGRKWEEESGERGTQSVFLSPPPLSSLFTHSAQRVTCRKILLLFARRLHVEICRTSADFDNELYATMLAKQMMIFFFLPKRCGNSVALLFTPP